MFHIFSFQTSRLVSSWILTSHQPHRVTSGQITHSNFFHTKSLNRKCVKVTVSASRTNHFSIHQCTITHVLAPIDIPWALTKGTCLNRLWLWAGWAILFRGPNEADQPNSDISRQWRTAREWSCRAAEVWTSRTIKRDVCGCHNEANTVRTSPVTTPPLTQSRQKVGHR